MSKEANLTTQERLGKLISAGELDGLDAIFAEDVVDHDPAPDQTQGPEGFKAFFAQLRTAFPDLNLEVEQLVADEDNIAIAYTISGTHGGDFEGLAPTGKQVSARGMQIARFEDGKIIERWGATNELALLAQLGVEPSA